MVRAFMAKWKVSPKSGDRPDHVSAILIPFLIVMAGLGVLAWRSYVLSSRMEHGVDTLAKQYAGYAADITARRIDAAVGNELHRASEEWQGVERRSPSSDELQNWVHDNDWIISALYVPDADPASAVFASEGPGAAHTTTRLTQELYSSSGIVRYTYDPSLLLARVQPVLAHQPLMQAQGLSQQAQVSIIGTPSALGAIRTGKGYAFVTPLAAPLASYAVRGFVETGYGTSGWENARLISILLSAFALSLTALGAYMAMRGLMREADTMKLRGALVANVSHELRTPLSMIRLGAETLKRGATRLPEKQRHEIEDSILREVLHLSHLVENVLDVARIQNRNAKALAFTPVYPRDLLTSLISTYESWIRSRGFDVKLHIDDAVEEQSWDRDAVSRAVLNLIDNAIKYSGDEHKAIDVFLRQTEASVVIEVRDRGIGIDADDLTHIFEPYYRAQFSDTQTRRGAGLGLTLVQQILASHGGTIEVESKPGAGSTFRLIFPRPQSRKTASLAQFAPQTL
ncbi:MAG TPA: HAMP domain-containing sensor histidine kinase [Thermoanaerobaculia bacterium]|jgi:signal transduction histidine kinase|nr:HAMP domain-containing sensor histidine kinase [Thermoanaerobaculia bacterium]